MITTVIIHLNNANNFTQSTDCKPVPLKTGEDEEYMLALKQELRGTMKKMPYFMPVEEEHEGLW